MSSSSSKSGQGNKNIYKVELAKSVTEHREPIITGFFVLQYAKVHILELYYNFFDNVSAVDKFEELEMGTNYLYLALEHENFYECIRPAKEEVWEDLRDKGCDDSFRADSLLFFHRKCCSKHKKHDKRQLGLFKVKFSNAMICLYQKTYCCYDAKSDKYKFSSKVLKKRTLEETGDGPMEKYQRVIDEIISLISINIGFRTINHCVVTYEWTKKGLSYFYPKPTVLSDGVNRAPPLNL